MTTQRPITEAGRSLLRSDFDTTAWGPSVVRDNIASAIVAIEKQAMAVQRNLDRSLIRELAETVHQTGGARDHHDPIDVTGWNVHGIETCQDPLCVEALAILRD